MVYRNVLVAKQSPDNLCFAEDGEVLVPAGSTEKMQSGLPGDDHFFVGVKTGMPSRYGWVKEQEQLVTAAELASLRYGDEVTEKSIQYCEIMLKSASRYTQGTPMACHFIQINLPGKEDRRLSVHKVIFYEA